MQIKPSTFNITIINLLLVAGVIILALLTVIWHHQNYILYKQSGEVERQNQQIVALHKQLLSEYSQQINGFQIKAKAHKILKMKPISPANNRVISL